MNTCFSFFKTLLNYAVRTHLHTSVSFLDSRGIIHKPQVSALPLPSPQLPGNKTACIITLLLLWYSKQIVHTVIFNWRKIRTNSVKCLVLHMNVLHCNIQTPSSLQRWRGRGVRKQWQWNAFAQVSLDAKPVTFLELIRQSECKERPCVC